MILIKKGRLIDPGTCRDEVVDVLIGGGTIARIDKDIATDGRRSGHRRGRVDRGAGPYRRAYAPEGARLRVEGDDQDRNDGGGAGRLHVDRLHGQYGPGKR